MGLGLLLATSACERIPSDKRREWKATDHDKSDPGTTGQVKTAPATSGSARNDEALVEVTWQNQCAACHGPIGRGDGPNGPIVHASDLTREDWQAKVTDADIMATIKNGKGMMPKFEMPEGVLKALVRRIRTVRGFR